MGKSQLVLELEDDVIAKARAVANNRGTTVAALVEGFLRSLGDDDSELAPITARLRGVLPASADADQYRRRLEGK